MNEDKPLRKIVAENLAELRKGRGLTQVQLADILGYSDKSVSKWERGDTTPDLETLHNLANYYGVTIDELTHEGMAKEKVQSSAKKSGGVNVWIIAVVSCMAVVVVLINLYVVILNNTGISHWTLFVWWIPIDSVILSIFGRNS